METQYDITKRLLDTIRGGRNRLNEAEDKGEAVAITNNPKFGTNVLKTQIDAFKASVHPGAKFSDENEDEPENNPMVYYPKTGNLVFSGSIPSLSNLKFQISMNDSTKAPYIFVDGLALTEETCEVLNKMAGFTKNFIDEWSAAGDILDSL